MRTCFKQRLHNVNFALVSFLMIICTTIGVYGMMVNNANGEAFLGLIATIVGPLIGILWNNIATKKIRQHVEVIEKNTNGTLSKLTDEIPEQVRTAVSEAMEQKGENTNADKHDH